jgi:peroxiredoxin
MTKRLLGLIFSFTALTVGADQTFVRAALEPSSARKPAPDFLLKDASAKAITLKSYRGKVVLLDFWATWCTGCKQEIPWFVDFQKTYGPQGFAVVGVSVDDDGWKVLTPFLAEHQIPYTMLLGSQATMQLFGLNNLPDTFLIDQEGRIAATYKAGLVDRANIEENIRAILAKRQ